MWLYPIIIFIYNENWQYSPECLATFSRMFEDIARNVWQYSRGCFRTFPGIFWQHSPECLETFREMLPSIPENNVKHSGECPQTFRGISSNIPGKIFHVWWVKKVITGAYSKSSNSLGFHPILQKFYEMIREIIVTKTVCGIFLIFFRSSFVSNFILKSNFWEP